MNKRIPEFFNLYAVTMTPISIARVLGARVQETNKISMQTLKAVQEQLSTHTETIVDNEARQRTAADDSLAARITTLELASKTLDARVPCSPIPCSPAPPPGAGAPEPEPPVPPPAAASSARKLPRFYMVRIVASDRQPANRIVH